MLLSAVSPQTLFSSNPCFLTCHCSNTSNPPTSPNSKSLKLVNVSSSSLSTLTTGGGLRHVSHTLRDGAEASGGDDALVTSAAAVASAIRGASTSPVEFVQVVEKDRHKTKLIMPSPDFQRLCVEQLDLFRQIVDPNAVLSVYVRPAGSYVMDRLELRRVTCYPGVNATDVVILVGNFRIPTGLRAAESALSSQKAEVVDNHRAVVFPMVKHPFVVGFLVAELPEGKDKGVESTHCLSPEEAYALPPSTGPKSPEFQFQSVMVLTAEQRSYAINISRTLAMAYVMDQKAMLLQQSSWQNNVRMSKLVEQIRCPLSSIRTLSKMLSVLMKRSEISYDIVEDILVQVDRTRDTLQELQDAVFLTKANIVRYNEETLRKMNNAHHEPMRSRLSDDFSREDSRDGLQKSIKHLSLNSGTSDLEMPMPPLALAPLSQHGRPCNVSDVLLDLVEAVRPLALKQQRVVELNEGSQLMEVAVEEPALRQALGNLIEGALLRTHVGGKVEIASSGAPAGGALVVIDDDGPDMHYMTQMHSLTPFGAELLSENMVEDNMTWNFVAGLTVAREILESYGCVVHVKSPRSQDAALGAGGTRVELWLPSFAALPEANNGGACE